MQTRLNQTTALPREIINPFVNYLRKKENLIMLKYEIGEAITNSNIITKDNDFPKLLMIYLLLDNAIMASELLSL